MEWIVCIRDARMVRAGIVSSYDLQASHIDGGKQFVAGTQAQVFGQVREQQPAFPFRRQVRRQATQESQQHAALWIVDRGFER